MRSLSKIAAGPMVLIAALALAGCGEQAEPVENEAVANLLESDTLFEPGNDVSAMEAAANEISAESTPLPDADSNVADQTSAEEPLGETSGGDTGGNLVDNDVSGM